MGIIEQLLGKCEEWDQVDTLVFVFYKPEKFSYADYANIDFEKGIIEICTDYDNHILKTFNIKATLEEIQSL